MDLVAQLSRIESYRSGSNIRTNTAEWMPFQPRLVRRDPGRPSAKVPLDLKELNYRI